MVSERGLNGVGTRLEWCRDGVRTALQWLSIGVAFPENTREHRHTRLEAKALQNLKKSCLQVGQ